MRELPKVNMFVEPTGLFSRAMVRVANAIKRHAPSNVVFVSRPEDADIQVLHVIDWDDAFLDWPRKYIAIQYCLKTTSHGVPDVWDRFWSKSKLTWSYYDLRGYLQFAFRESSGPRTDDDQLFCAPLGADTIFRDNAVELLTAHPAMSDYVIGTHRDLIVTSGYVSARGAEAIEDVWNAAERSGWSGVHIGPPRVEGMRRLDLPKGWTSVEGCTDETLASYYRRAFFVSGLRYTEGFELPALEGLLCGAWPLLFDQPSQREWFGGLDLHSSVFLPESYPAAGGVRCLSSLLEEKFTVAKYVLEAGKGNTYSTPMGTMPIAQALAKFNWASIVPDMFEAAGL